MESIFEDCLTLNIQCKKQNEESAPGCTIATSSQKRNLKEKLPYESDGRIERQNYTYESDGTDTKAK